jgi:hypothetical protein
VVPKVRLGASGSRRAATDRRRDQHDPWRTVTDCRIARALTPSFTCRFPTILPDLLPFDVQAGGGALDLTRKRSQVQTLSRPPHNTPAQSVVGASSAALLSFPDAPGATLGSRPDRRGTAPPGSLAPAGRCRRARPGGRGAPRRPPDRGGRSLHYQHRRNLRHPEQSDRTVKVRARSKRR